MHQKTKNFFFLHLIQRTEHFGGKQPIPGGETHLLFQPPESEMCRTFESVRETCGSIFIL